jgi:subtilisin family serine protease
VVPACRLVVIALLFNLVAASSLWAQGPENYIVLFRQGTDQSGRGAAVQGAGAAMRFTFNGVDAAAIRVANANALAALQRHPSVLAIIPDRPVSAYQQGNAKAGAKPASGGLQQVIPAGVTRVGVPTTTSNGEGVGVAVLDTGVDLAHPDLAGTVNAFSAFGGSCQDGNGHGTHVAGTVAAQDNAGDVVGVAPKARIYCVKVLDNSGSGSDATVMAGLDWVLSNHDVVDPPIRVVNMSLGREGAVGDNPALHDLILALGDAGIAVVVSAGNDPGKEVSQQIPAGYSEVIAVASTTASGGSNQCRFLSSPVAADTASYFTTDGAGVTVSAPGEDSENVSRGCLITSTGILSTRLGGGTTRMSGTSMASPHVAGIAARHFQSVPWLSISVLRQLLQSDADRAGAAPLNSPAASYTFDGEREGVAQAP